MCLDTKTRIWRRPDPERIIEAYKIFAHADSNGVESAVRGYRYLRGAWVRAQEVCIYIRSTSYTTGFHAFLDRHEAREYKSNLSREDCVYVILPVLLRGVHTKGTQDGLTVIVAREMLVPMK